MTKLIASKIQFFSTTDNKDHDTKLKVQVFTSAGVLVADNPYDYGNDTFNDPAPSPIIPLNVLEQRPKSEFLESGHVAISIVPNGHDTWKFDFILDLFFDDGTLLSCIMYDQSLDQNSRGRTYWFRDDIAGQSTHDKPLHPSSGPHLTVCNVQFHSNADGKDFDTNVLMFVQDANGFVAARTGMADYFGAFNKNSNNGPYPLQVINQSSKSLFGKNNGQFTISIAPNGNDTWDFNYTVRLTFSDDSTIVTTGNEISLNQDIHHCFKYFPIN